MENIAIVSGGFSGESVISIKSAKYVADNLDSDLYKGFVIIIDRSGWYYTTTDNQRIEINKNDFSLQIQDEKINFSKIFNIIHGDPGENGKLTSYFELLGLPSTSCDSMVGALTFNKAFCNKVVGGLGVNIAAEVYLNKGDSINSEDIIKIVGLPCFVKPNSGGSSIGMSKVKNMEELKPAIERAFQEDSQVLIEEFVKGREVTCGIIKTKGKTHILPLCEVVSKKEYFDYEAKYNPDLAEEIIPAPISTDFETTIKNTTSFLYNRLGCKGVVRMDYIITENNVYFLEVNTIPGLSSASIVPQMARAYGWTNTELINNILEEAN